MKLHGKLLKLNPVLIHQHAFCFILFSQYQFCEGRKWRERKVKRKTEDTVRGSPYWHSSLLSCQGDAMKKLAKIPLVNKLTPHIKCKEKQERVSAVKSVLVHKFLFSILQSQIAAPCR